MDRAMVIFFHSTFLVNLDPLKEESQIKQYKMDLSVIGCKLFFFFLCMSEQFLLQSRKSQTHMSRSANTDDEWAAYDMLDVFK